MVDFCGDIRDQEHDVRIEDEDLVITMNGHVMWRAQLPPSKWRELRDGAAAILSRPQAPQ